MQLVEPVDGLQGGQVGDVQPADLVNQGLGGVEQRHLHRGGPAAALARSSCRGAGLLQFGQHLPGPANHPLGQPGQLGHVYSVAFVGAAGHDPMQEYHVAFLLGDSNGEIAHPGQAARQLGKLMVVGGKQGLATQPRVVVQVLDDRPGDGKAVISAGAPADLVQDYQGPGRGLIEDGCGFQHLDHEGRLAGGQVVLEPHPGEDAVHQPHGGLLRRDEAAQLGHQCDEGDLADKSGLSGHVGSSQHDDPGVVGGQVDLVGHVGAGLQHLLNHRMAPSLDLDGAAEVQAWPHVAVLNSDLGEAVESIHLSNGVRHLGNRLR